MYLRSQDKHGRDAEKNLDLRIRKTRRAIRSGLLKACQAKPYAHVSVADICRASMVSRTTFYDHYTDKDALLAEVVSFLLEEITPALEGLWFGEERDARTVARHLADVYARNGQALTTLLAIRVGGDGDLHEQLYRTCCSVFTDWRAVASTRRCSPWPRTSTPPSSSPSSVAAPPSPSRTRSWPRSTARVSSSSRASAQGRSAVDA